MKISYNKAIPESTKNKLNKLIKPQYILKKKGLFI